MDSAICGTLIVSAEIRYCDSKCVLKFLKKRRVYSLKGESCGNALPEHDYWTKYFLKISIHMYMCYRNILTEG